MAEQERPVPITDVEKRADSVLGDLDKRLVPEPYLKALGKAVADAEKPLGGRAGSDAAIGRIGGKHVPKADEPVWD